MSLFSRINSQEKIGAVSENINIRPNPFTSYVMNILVEGSAPTISTPTDIDDTPIINNTDTDSTTIDNIDAADYTEDIEPFVSNVGDDVVDATPDTDDFSVSELYSGFEGDYSYNDEDEDEDEDEDDKNKYRNEDTSKHFTEQCRPAIARDYKTRNIAKPELAKYSETSPSLVEGSSKDPRTPRVDQIVDGLFDRMQTAGIWREQQTLENRPQPQKENVQLLSKHRKMFLAESKRELKTVIHQEMPRILKTEVVSMLQTEVLKAVRSELSRLVRDEFESLRKLLDNISSRLSSLEPRLAKIEGAADKDTIVKIAKGAVQNNFEIPEREVKVAAPINVQPPAINVDEGAVTLQVNKPNNQSHKDIEFERDHHDRIMRATIVNDKSD